MVEPGSVEETVAPSAPSPEAVAAHPHLERLLADARKHLFETGTRNRLIHTPRGAKRTRSLTIVGARTDLLFEQLVRAGKTHRFAPAPGKAVALPAALPASMPDAQPAPNTLLRTALESDPLEKRLLGLYRDARTAEEEQGINILFLATGFLRWYEDDKSSVLREAPLILIPVSLARDVKRSTFELRLRDEDLVTNQALQERLRADFEIALPALPEDEEWTPSAYFASVKEAVSVKPRWSIDPDGVELGFYSFSKLLMIRDLDPANWSQRSILAHPLLDGLMVQGFGEEAAPFPADAKLDALFAPGDLVQVVDADASQTIVIETVRKGRNLVVQGPPGTGKSQTITNMIASAVHDGKSVLFVAEKMAALNVVHDRLQRAGLGQLCLELHSRSASKRAVLEELERTLETNKGLQDNAQELDRLTSVRTALNAVAERLHTPVGDSGLTPFRILSHLISARENGIRSYPPSLAEAGAWSGNRFNSLASIAGELGSLSASAGPIKQHPYYGVEATHLQPAEVERLAEPLSKLAAAASAHAEQVESLSAYIGLDRPATGESSAKLLSILETIATLENGAAEIAAIIDAKHVQRILNTANVGVALNSIIAGHKDVFVDAAFETPAIPLHTDLTAGLSFFGRWFSGTYRRASRLLATLIRIDLPSTPVDRIALVDTLVALQKHKSAIAAEDGSMLSLLGSHWQGEKTDFLTLHTAAQALQTLAQEDGLLVANAIEIAQRKLAQQYIASLSQAASTLATAANDVLPVLSVDVSRAFVAAGREHIPLRALAAKAEVWRDNRNRFDEYRRLASADSRLREFCVSYAEALADGVVKGEQAQRVIACTWHEAQWSKAVAASRELQDFNGPDHDQRTALFRDLETRRRAMVAGLVRAQHEKNMPRGALGEMGVIRSEIKKRRGHMAIRKLVGMTGETLRRIKPVMLMSPISVAQFLPPGSITFDLLVIDEASQVRPEDALGLVARCRQIVVVGDNKQLPPTSFFDRMVADEEEPDEIDEEAGPVLAGAAKATAMESILSLCEARGLSSEMLRWHYRSRHPSLIEVSNAEFYRRLIMPPAPTASREHEGMLLRRVPGVYDRGGKRMNAIEAAAIVDAVAAHARITPHLSHGIATFSTAQRDAITDLLDTRRRTDEVLDSFLREGKAEDVFVKNLENVQGDERDVIMISVGYGPRIAGGRLDSMNFGPVSSEGGERRLNVLFTRARSRCEIFVSFVSGDIDTERARGEGPRVLKRFLQYAETGVLEERRGLSEDGESPFEDAVATIIRDLGYEADKQVGSAGFRIDLAVRDPERPGRYILAVECDGATWHSALWARERDRLRQAVLENLGWRFYRIWSTDWFYRREEAIAALKSAIEDAKAAPAAPRDPEPVASVPAGHTAEEIGVIQPLMRPTLPAYAVADCTVPADREPHEAPVSELARIAAHIVETEGPVHQDEVARRVAALFGKARAGSQISAASLRALQLLASRSEALQEDQFWMTSAQREYTPVRDRSAAPPSVQRSDMISPLELQAAARFAIRQNGEMPEEELLAAVARLLGFRRTGPELRVAIQKALSLSIANEAG